MPFPRSRQAEATATAALVQTARTRTRRVDSDRAYQQLMERYEPRLRALLRERLGSAAVADDVAQEACLTAWQQLDSLGTPALFGAWLCGIGRNLAKERRRQDRRDVLRGAAPLDAQADAEPIDPGGTPYSDLEWRALCEQLARELGELRPGYRDVLEMYYQHHLPCDEIARRLQISITAVHKRLARGRKQLGRELAGALGTLAPLGTSGALASSPGAFVAAVMRAVRSQRGRRRGPIAAGAAGALAGWQVLARTVAAPLPLAALAVLAVGGVLWAAEALHDAVVPPQPDEPPRRALSSVPPPRPPVLPPLPGELPDDADDPFDAAPGAAPALSTPDYVVRSESTEPDSAIFGAHDLRPMDAYGQQLYELVSKAFVMHLAMCTWTDVVGQDDRSRIEIDLQFSLWPGRTRPGRFSDVVARADERDITYQLTGVELSKNQRRRFAWCLQEAFEKTRYPPPAGASRSIRHHIVVDFCVIAQTLVAMAATSG